LARGKEFSAKAAPEATRQSAVARTRNPAMDVSGSGMVSPRSLGRKTMTASFCKPVAFDADASAACANLPPGASLIDKKTFLGERQHVRIVTP
jgi:hypothetical protein